MRLLTADDLSERWQVSKDLVYEMTRRGDIPVVKLGRCYRYHPDQIAAYENDTWRSER
jgi:excisionase family DNA binding protein